MIHFYAADAEIIATLQCTLRLPRTTKRPPTSPSAPQGNGLDGWAQVSDSLVAKVNLRRRRTDA
jgi:hypothetical protein